MVAEAPAAKVLHLDGVRIELGSNRIEADDPGLMTSEEQLAWVVCRVKAVNDMIAEADADPEYTAACAFLESPRVRMAQATIEATDRRRRELASGRDALIAWSSRAIAAAAAGVLAATKAKARMVETAFGSVRLRTVKGGTRWAEGVATKAEGFGAIETTGQPALAWALEHCPSAVKFTAEVQISRIPPDLLPERFVTVVPDRDEVTIATR